MTIDEAIKHAEEVASRMFDDRVHCIKCAEEHRQLVEWLKDYKRLLEQQQNTWNLDDAREDFMYDVYNTLHFLPTNNEANRIIDSFDRVTSSIKQEPCCNCIEFKRYAKQMGFKIEAQSIPYLMHKEMDIPLLECQKAYDVAIEYLRSQGKVRG